MNYQELKEIRERLAKWCEDRHLTLESQQAGYIGNILEELTEYARAKTIFEQIDALCDIVVFSINAIDKQKQILLERQTIESLENASPENVAKAVLGGIDKGVILAGFFTNPICFCINLLDSLGFNPYKCLDETLKEIESRTGEYSNDMKKFIKDKGVYHQYEIADLFQKDSELEIIDKGNYFEVATYDKIHKVIKWYKADYARCKK